MAWLDSLIRDLRLGVRMLLKNAVVTAAAVLSLALALGACIAAFSLVDALILRPLPVQAPERLIYLSFPTFNPERPVSETFNDPLFVSLRDASRDYVDLFAMSTQVMRPAIFDAGGEKEQVRTQYVSGNAFELLGLKSSRGRLISRQDDSQPFTAAAVISHSFWLRRFGGDPSIIGRSVTIEGRPFEIVGVTEETFEGVEPGRPTDFWFPYASYNPRAFGNATFSWFRIFGLLKDRVRPESAQSVLQAVFTNFRRERQRLFDPGRTPEEQERWISARIDVRPAANGPSDLRRQFGQSLSILGAIAVLVLLIAGSNIGNLFLARGASREREMALRLSIGAGRGRLIQQVLIESGLVAATACLLGLIFALIAAPSVLGMLASTGDPLQLDLRLNGPMLAFAALLTLLATALFGVVPAFRASSLAPMTALKAGGRFSVRAGMMRPFVVVQLAFGLVVLFVGSLLVLSFGRLAGVHPGFTASNVMLLDVETTQRVDAGRQREALFGLIDRLRAIPNAKAVAAAEFNALGRAWTVFIRLPGTPNEAFEATMSPVTDGYFDAMEIRVLSGRAFTRQDMDANNSAIIINEAFARRYFGQDIAVGRSIEGRFNSDNDNSVRYNVVGIVADTRYDLRRSAAPILYAPLRTSGTIHVRVAGDPSGVTAQLRDAIRSADPLFRVTSVRSQSAVVDRTLIRERLLADLSGFFALVGLVLVVVGFYGVLSYSVIHRTREIAIRVALGARPSSVMRTVLMDFCRVVLLGAVSGIAGGFYLSRFVETLLFEVRPQDFLSVALPLVTLLLAVSLAAILPAIRAARVDPVIALRSE
jgi:predicted permease